MVMKISEQDIEQLSPVERLELIERLWDSLQDEQVPLRAEIRAELEKRLKTYEQDRASAVPWEDVKSRLLREP
jgi:putative addiction module component (TIGR02574 family)